MICNRGLGTAMLDISEASRSNGANAQLWEANGSGVPAVHDLLRRVRGRLRDHVRGVGA